MVYEYTDDSTKKRVSDQFKANMKFFQYNSSANSLGGNGVEVDTNAKGDQQTLAFSWYVNTDGNIYIKYTKSGNVFVLDSKSDKNGFHLGYEKEKGYDTFFGTASAQILLMYCVSILPASNQLVQRQQIV